MHVGPQVYHAKIVPILLGDHAHIAVVQEGAGRIHPQLSHGMVHYVLEPAGG